MLQPRLLLTAIVSAWLVLSPVTASAVPTPSQFADVAFETTWARTDQPVAGGVVSATWIWGPAPLGDGMLEPYAEAPNGERLVQYFDKSRMEITHPEGDAGSSWYVTNGLLVTEMITGRMQVGDGESVLHYPSETPVAGDLIPRNGPSYATFTNLNDAAAARVGEAVIERIDWEGVIEVDPALAGYGVTLEVFDETTEHNIAAPFWRFMTSSRTVYVDGQYREAPLFENPYYATGRPLTEPYWADVVVAGTPHLVLVQCFERRCLTYTPENPQGWQVEAGNVGQHYFQWRYGQSTASGTLLYTYSGELFTVNADGSDLRNLTAHFEPAVVDAEWSPDGKRIAFVGADSQFTRYGAIFAINADGSDVRQLTSGPFDAAPTWSPNGTRLAFDRVVTDTPTGSFYGEESQIFIVNADGSSEQQVTDIPSEVDFSHSWSPAWSPDGQHIAFVNINGTPGPPRTLDSTIYVMHPDGSDLTAVTETTSFAEPIWSPDGGALAFVQPGGGGGDFVGSRLWVINVDGSERRQLAGGERTDPRDAAWAPGGDWIAFAQSEGLADTPGQPAGIHLVRPDGDERVQLTHFGEWPAWSPDGRHVAFATFSGVVVMERDGGGLAFVAEGFGPPQWRPVAQ